jgi:hypothetical protein
MWAAIRSAAEALLADDLALASAILEASNISTPNGTLELAYDELGHQYKIPIFCLVNPVDLINPNEKVPQATLVSSTKEPRKVVDAQPLNVR